MLQHASWTHVQDENAGAAGVAGRGALQNGALGALPTKGLQSVGAGGGGGALKPMGGQGGPLRSSRRPLALGNLTNVGLDAAQPTSDAKKRGAPPAAPRRAALGDITNSAGAGQRAASVKPASATPEARSLATPFTRSSTTGLSALSGASSLAARAEALAREVGVERPAGKGWSTLEAERVREEESRLAQRVRSLAAPLASWQPRSAVADAVEVGDGKHGRSMHAWAPCSMPTTRARPRVRVQQHPRDALHPE